MYIQLYCSESFEAQLIIVKDQEVLHQFALFPLETTLAKQK